MYYKAMIWEYVLFIYQCNMLELGHQFPSWKKHSENCQSLPKRTYLRINIRLWSSWQCTVQEWRCISKPSERTLWHESICVAVEEQEYGILVNIISLMLSSTQTEQNLCQMSAMTWKWVIWKNSNWNDPSLPAQCWMGHNSCCGWLPADCSRIRQRLRPARGWSNTHLDTSESQDHCGIQEDNEALIMQQCLLFSATSLPVFLWARVAKRSISGATSGGTTPSHDEAHRAVEQGAEKLPRMKQLTQQGNFGDSNSWDNCRR